MQLADRISSAITQYTRYTVFDDLGGTVDNGVVTLTGKVTMPYKRDDLEKRVARIDGVKTVKNEISVLPVSIYDDQLRIADRTRDLRQPVVLELMRRWPTRRFTSSSRTGA